MIRPSRPLLLAAVLAVFVAQPVFDEYEPPLVVAGIVDEAAHVGTALLVLANVPRIGTLLAAAALVASVLIDLDHLPLSVFGTDFLTEGTPRPYPHSLTTPLLALGIAALAAGRIRQAALGVALGTSVHLFRDLATGPGAALLWPASEATAQLPYVIYAAAVAALFARAWLAAGRARGGEPLKTRP